MSRLVSGTFFLPMDLLRLQADTPPNNLHLYGMKERVISFFRLHTDALFAATAACIFIYCFTRHSGIGISPDSVMYWSTATHIREQFAFTDFNGLPLTDFPLGYPSLLALLSFLSGISVLALAPVCNAVLISTLILLSSHLLQQDGRFPQPFKALLLALLACSPALLEIYAMLWSETLFLVEGLLLLTVLHRYGKTHRSGSLLFCGLITAFAFVTRYAGISLLALGFGMLLLDPELSVRKKIKHIAVYVLLSVSLAAVNLIRNHYASGHSTGVREKALRGLSDNLQQMGSVFSGWFPFSFSNMVAMVAVVMILLLCLFYFLNRWLQASYFWTASTLITGWFLSYAVFILGIATVSRFEDLSSRLLSPLYIPLLIIVSGALLQWRLLFSGLTRKFFMLLLLLFYAAFHYNHYQLNAEAWEGIKDAGMPGYAEDSWQQSPAVNWLRQHKDSLPQPLYANAPDAVFFFTGLKALPLPHKDISTEHLQLLRQKNLTLVWLVDGENTDLVGLPFISKQYDTSQRRLLEGGTVYYLKPLNQ
jgi:hypothetical protein